MRVRPHRNPTSFFPGNFEQINAEILPIGVAINFNCLVEVSREGKALDQSAVKPGRKL